MLRNKFILLILLLLTACHTVNPSVLEGNIDNVVVDQELMKDCADLKLLSYPTSFEEIIQIHAANTQSYVECKYQNEAKKRFIQDFISKGKQK